MLGIILKSGRWLYPSQETSKFAGWYIKQLFDSFHSCQYRPPVHAWADSRIPSQSSVPWWSLAWGASLRPSPRSLGSCQPWVPLHGISPGPCHPWPMGLAMVPAWLRPPLSSGWDRPQAVIITTKCLPAAVQKYLETHVDHILSVGLILPSHASSGEICFHSNFVWN